METVEPAQDGSTMPRSAACSWLVPQCILSDRTWKIQGCKRGFPRSPSAPYKALQSEQPWTDLLGLPQPLLKFPISLYRSDISMFQADSHFCSSGYHQVGCWHCACSPVFLQLLTMENFPKGMAGNPFSWETYFQNSSLL